MMGRVRWGAAGMLALMSLGACGDSFLRGIEPTKEPNDGGACAPNGRVLDFAAQAFPDRVTLSFTTDATDAEGILIERAIDGPALQWGELTRVGAETASFSDFGAERGQRFVYRGFTYRRADTGECTSLSSDELVVTTFPIAPENVTVAQTLGGVEVRWSDTNNFEQGYRVERRASGIDFSTAVEAAVDSVVAVDTAPVAGSDLEYRVVAFNQAGSTPSLGVSLTSSVPPSLSWVDAPYMSTSCELVVPGDVQFAPGAMFASATGDADIGSTGGSANATQASIALSSTAPGDVTATWTVRDTLGAESSLTRDVELGVVTTSRSRERPGTRTVGDGFTGGGQAVFPNCATCNGRRGHLAAGGRFACALTSEGGVDCWGNTAYGKLGRGNSYTRVWPAVRACGSLECDQPLQALEVASRSSTTCARTLTGEVWCWGAAGSGQLGRGYSLTFGTITPLPVCELGQAAPCSPMTGTLSVGVAANFACAVMADSRIACWGSAANGTLGNGFSGFNDQFDVPTLVCESGVWDGAACAGGAALTGAVNVDVGADHACALLQNGRVMCWGSNNWDQVGDDSGVDQATAVFVGGGTPLENVVEIALGESHSCARLQDGTARCWGRQSSGELGTGLSSGSQTLPAEVCETGEVAVDCVPLADIRQIVAGTKSTCARVGDSGAVYCWGDNDDGVLGNGLDTGEYANPTAVCQSGAWDGSSCFGGAPLTGVERISFDREKGCAYPGDGTALCWGDNSSGRLGDGTTVDRPNPVSACRDGTGGTCTPETDVAFIASGVGHSCSISDNTLEVRCWGSPSIGQLADGVGDGGQFAALPACVQGRGADCTPFQSAVALATGAAHACALLDDGTVWCWGDDTHGELGRGSFELADPPSPSPVCADASGGCTPLTNAVSVVSGGTDFFFDASLPRGHTCAVLEDGTARCWGDNRSGQLGAGSQTAVSGPCTSTCFSNTSCASNECYDLDTFSCFPKLSCNGICDSDLCFNLDPGVAVPQPILCGEGCPGGELLSDIAGIAAGADHTCAWFDDGRAKCWGGNGAGQLGVDQLGVNRTLPVFVPISGVVSMVAGLEHTCALLEDGRAQCWGDNNWGQLGDGKDQGRATPGFVCARGIDGACEPLEGIVSLASGSQHTCALMEDGTVMCFGRNGGLDNLIGFMDIPGMLGRGIPELFDSYPVPQPVCATDLQETCQATYVCDQYLRDVVAISAGFNFTCALLQSGETTCWGSNLWGQLGQGRVADATCLPGQRVCKFDEGCAPSGASTEFAVRSCDVVTVSTP